MLDFTNPTAVAWYRAKLGALLRMGVGVIKADFGEGAPVDGHLRSTAAPAGTSTTSIPCATTTPSANLTKEITGDGIIWGRSAWAGSQRYPLHWGGDAENTNSAMAAELRGGLSFGLSGFTFWSHDVGGFVEPRAARPLSPLDGVRGAHVAHAHARRAAARAVGVRRRRW